VRLRRWTEGSCWETPFSIPKPRCFGRLDASDFSSTRSFKNRNPFGNAGEELVDGLEVFLLKVREVLENLASVMPEAR
jgi:hypothetical protein